MSDRVLLEKAAKAAGYDDAKYQDMKGWGEVRYGLSCGIWSEKHLDDYWNPLESDGDALRLAVKLKIPLQFPDWGDLARTWGAEDSNETHDETARDHGGDLGAATRRAIVRAAAALADAGGRDE